MNVPLTVEEQGGVLMAATVVAVMVWYSTSLTGVSRIINPVIAGLITAAVMAVGLWMLN